VSGAAIEPLESRNGWSCPSTQPSYCGWFDKPSKQPPCCVKKPSHPKPHPKPSCSKGTAPYCARDPGHACPYGESDQGPQQIPLTSPGNHTRLTTHTFIDENNEYCWDDGTTHCDCYDETLTVIELEVILGEIFCPLSTAYPQLGSNCLCSDVCVAAWVTLDLGCSASDLVSLTVDADVSVLGIDIGLDIGLDIGI
jgi:hypothetical protein